MIDYKYLANIIKSAEGKKGVPAAGSAGSAGGGGGGGGGGGSVLEMQKHLKECIDLVKKYGKVDGQTKPSKETTAFHDLFVNTQMDSEDSGFQHEDGDSADEYDSNDHQSNLETFKQLQDSWDFTGAPGNPGSELVPDGNWGFRTNNAVRNLAAYISALYNVTKNLKVPSARRSTKNMGEVIKTLHECVLETVSSTDPTLKPGADANASTNAGKFNGIFPQIKSYIHTVYDSILKDPILSKFITTDHPIATFNKQDKFFVSETDKKEVDDMEDDAAFIDFNHYQIPPIKDRNGQEIRTVSLKVLADKDAFDTYFKDSLKYNPTDYKSRAWILSTIYKGLDAWLQKKTTTTPPATPTTKAPATNATPPAGPPVKTSAKQIATNNKISADMRYIINKIYGRM